MRRMALNVTGLFLLLFIAGSLSRAQTARTGFATPLSEVKFEGDDTKCLKSATENGNPEKGPSTFILKASPGCVVPWHYHTAEEQLIVVQGDVLTEMEGMSGRQMGVGGFAMMPSRAKHQFSCKSKDECILFVTFDRKYDIVWVKDADKPK